MRQAHSAGAFRRRLIVMVREPRAGRVKSRLARGTSTVAATAFYRATTAAVLARLWRPGEWELILAVDPGAAVQSRSWRRALARRPQVKGDLGARMQAIMDDTLPGPVVIIGSDVPAITAPLVRRAFATLGSHDAVFGPSGDGGYWLVGLKRFPRVPRVFDDVRWSTAHALADTRRNLAGHRVAMTSALDDVDEAADLARCGGTWGRRIAAPALDGVSGRDRAAS